MSSHTQPSSGPTPGRRQALRLMASNVGWLPQLLLAACMTASAEGLHDSGYGDGSLVDSSGNYYYPQPHGGYLDAYGSSYSPIGDGLYTDAIGNTIESPVDAAGMDPDAPDTQGAEVPVNAHSSPRAKHARAGTAPDGARTPTTASRSAQPGSVAPTALTGTPNDDTLGPGDGAEFGSMYLEDVGDGYLHLDPDQVAGDPRLARPAPPARAAGKPAQPAEESQDPAAADPNLPFDDAAEGPASSADQRNLPALEVSPGSRKYDAGAQFKGTGSHLKPLGRATRVQP